MTRIFVSYSRTDVNFARRLADSLARMGADIWMDIEDIPAGLKWSSAIQQGLDSAELIIVVISPESMASRNVEDEWQYFLDNNKPVIPVLLRQTKIHFQLSRIQYIDFLHATYEEGFERLKYEMDRRGFPLGIPMSAPMNPPPPQSFGHPVGSNQTYIPPSTAGPRPASSSRRWLIAGGGLAVLVVLAGIILLMSTRSKDDELANLTLTPPIAINTTRIADITETAIVNQTLESQTATAAAQVTNIVSIPTTIIPTNPPSDPTVTSIFIGPVAHNTDWTVIKREISGVSMVLVPGGRFTMGAGQRQLDNDAPLCEQQLKNRNVCHDVLLSDENGTQEVTLQPFWIDTYEVADSSGIPVNNITWLDAQHACEQRGTRLPTEAEWEYASRGPDGWAYPWGNQYDGARLNVCDQSCHEAHNDYTWADESYSDGYSDRAPVGSFPSGKSWVGAEDLAGNLWEWTSTIYAQDIRNGRENNNDLTAPRVLKGSSWNWIGVEGRGTSRADIAEGVRDQGKSDWYGFRCVRDFDPEDLN
ncbi:MAG TPA: SUMF1/EgtB/PvdO family nonheme iron enzyme [Phototrophicaceae bacterium]|jgi:formylglycine-generating enzyme required for sulfatase activity|nr:SUMF1/EgtB/PvdO family nonheme iron enzyme [Phototrophicaceae bacterium]